jgi:hypothetical protein
MAIRSPRLSSDVGRLFSVVSLSASYDEVIPDQEIENKRRGINKLTNTRT